MKKLMMRPLFFPAAIATIFLLVAMVHQWAEGFYVVVRAVVCAMAVWGLIVGFVRKVRVVAWPMLAVAVLFNPFVQIHFHSRPVWQVVDLIVIALFWVAVYLVGPKSSSSPAK